MLDNSAVDLDSSTCETGSVTNGDDINGSLSSSVLAPLGRIDDHLGDGLLHKDSTSSDAEDITEENIVDVNGCNYFQFYAFHYCLILHRLNCLRQ